MENVTSTSGTFRVSGTDRELGIGDIALTAFRVPHSGWPTRRLDIENLVFQVTLNNETTVAHFGDADANLEGQLVLTDRIARIQCRSDNADAEIELVDIDDLRAAFGGEGEGPAPEQQAGIYAPTRMCSGWT